MPVTSTWNEREVPLLEAVYAAEETGDRPTTDDLATATGIELAVVARTVAALVESRHADGINATAKSDPFPTYLAVHLREKGRRAIGQWPAGVGEAFVEDLNRLIAAETDPRERSRLERLRDAAGDIAKQTLAGAIVAAGTALSG